MEDPRNTFSPSLDLLKEVDDDEDEDMLVMLLYREYASPPFDTVGEVLELLGHLIQVHSVQIMMY
jgi:hypothetical protein